MGADERLDLADQLTVQPGAEVGLDPVLRRREAQLLETGDLGLRERLVQEVGEGGAAPERERRVEGAAGSAELARLEGRPALTCQLLEAHDVERVRCEVEDVSRG